MAFQHVQLKVCRIIFLWNKNFFLETKANILNREEKLLRQVALVANFLDDNKPKTSLTKSICTVSNFIDVTQFHLIYKILAKLYGVEPERNVSGLEKRKRQCWAVLTNSIKRASEIRKFHVTDLQGWLRNVQKSVRHMQSCSFADINWLLLCRSFLLLLLW